jgi:hypothetical protein
VENASVLIDALHVDAQLLLQEANLQGHPRFSPDENRHAESHYRGGTERNIERMPGKNQGDRIKQNAL